MPKLNFRRFLTITDLLPLLLVLLVAAILWATLEARSARDHIGTLSGLSARISDDVTAFQANPASSDTMDSLEADLIDLKAELAATRQDLRIPLFVSRFLGWVPSIGNDLRSASPLVDAGSEATDAGTVLITTARKAMSIAPSLMPTQSQPGEPLDTLLMPTLQGLQQAQKHLLSAESSLAVVKNRNLRPSLRTLADKIDGALQQADSLVKEGLTAIDIASQLTESKEEKRFLLAAQNADELRATGGFIPGAWLIRIADGRIQPLVFYDSPSVDDLSKQYPPPPEWLGKTLWGGIWVFRDAFWFPNFPDSAQAAESLFLLGRGLDVDGVMAFDQWLLPSILEAAGPITVPGLNEAVTKSNVLDVVRRGTDEEGRTYLNTIMLELLKVSEGQSNGSKLTALAVTARKMLEEKHLLIYLDDQQIQNMILARNWGGATSQEDSDYLMVVDSNVGYNKVNANIVESIDYSVLLTDANEKVGRLQIDYENQSRGFSPVCMQGVPVGNPPYEEASQGCYWDYLRVYIPQKASPLAWPSFQLPAESLYAQNDPFHDADTFRVYTESNKTVLSGLNVIPQKAGSTLVFSYQLPDSVISTQNGQAQYTLHVQKQAGTIGHSFHFSISYPRQWQLQYSNLSPSRSQPGKLEFNLNLTTDVEINLLFKTD